MSTFLSKTSAIIERLVIQLKLEASLIWCDIINNDMTLNLPYLPLNTELDPRRARNHVPHYIELCFWIEYYNTLITSCNTHSSSSNKYLYMMQLKLIILHYTPCHSILLYSIAPYHKLWYKYTYWWVKNILFLVSILVYGLLVCLYN